MGKVVLRDLSPSQVNDVIDFIEELGLIPTCLITPSLARAYAQELSARNLQQRADRVCSDLERDIINEALKDLHDRNNNRLHRWRRDDPLFPQLTINFD